MKILPRRQVTGVSSFVSSHTKKTTVGINGKKYKFNIIGNVEITGDSVTINDIKVIENGALTAQGRELLR